MASLTISLPHKLQKEEALKRVKNLLTQTKEQFSDVISNLKENWDDNKGQFSFKAKGFDISGTLTVSDSSVELDGKIPWAASLFSGKIKDTIKQEADKLLS